MRYFLTCSAVLFATILGNTQTLPDTRKTDWSIAGIRSAMPEFTATVDFVEAGGVGDGVSINNDVLSGLFDEYAGEVLEIYFPAGTFFFTEGISLPANCLISGVSADSTTLKFDLGGERPKLLQRKRINNRNNFQSVGRRGFWRLCMFR